MHHGRLDGNKECIAIRDGLTYEPAIRSTGLRGLTNGQKGELR